MKRTFVTGLAATGGMALATSFDQDIVFTGIRPWVSFGTSMLAVLAFDLLSGRRGD